MIVRLLILLGVCAQLLAASVIITDTTEKLSDFTLSCLYDEKRELGIDEVAQRSFTREIPSQFTLGYRDGNLWFRLELENRSSQRDFVLYFTEPFWAEFDLYEPLDSGFLKHKNGLLTPLEERGIEDLSPAFSLQLEPGERKTYFIMGRTHNGQLGAFELYSEKEFFRPSRLTLYTFYLFYSGVLFIIIVLNFVLLAEMRERIYVYYIGYVAAFIVFISMFSASYLTLGLAGWDEGLHTVGTVVLMFMALFSTTFLELERYYPKMDRLFKSLAVVFIIMGVLISQGLPYVTLVFNILSAILMSLLLLLAVRTWMLGYIKTRYYLIALIIYMPTMALMALTFNGLLNNTDFSRYAFLAGALMEIIFFSLILASRFHSAKYDEIRLQRALLDEKQKNEQVLQEEIARQHREINEKNAILLHQSRHAAMGEMISMIAHQWRQPLSAISGHAGAMQIKITMDKYDKEKFSDQLAQIVFLSDHLSTTIDDFRDFFKENRQTNSFQPGETIKHALSLSESLFKSEKIVVQSRIESERTIQSYENELIQVLLNILKNAHDALMEKSIAEPKIIISLVEETPERLKITIEDNAGGIPEAIAPKIFEPYFSTKSKNGTGLGLYMSKSIIEEHCNGTLTFHNGAEGACFTIVLPV